MSKSIFAQTANNFLALGYSPIPVRPFAPDWSRYCLQLPTSEEIATWSKWPKCDIAFACGFNGLIAIDVDDTRPEVLDAVRDYFPMCEIGCFGSKGFCMFARSASGPRKGFKIWTGEGENKQVLLEVLGIGANKTVPPSIHAKTHEPYLWVNPIAKEVEACRPSLSELPILSDEKIDGIIAHLAQWASKPKPPPKPRSRDTNVTSIDDKRWKRYSESANKNETDQLAARKEGRASGLFLSACRTAKYVHHKYLSQQEWASAHIDASKINGHLAKVGIRAIEATLDSALSRSVSDELPELINRRPNRKQRRVNGASNGHDTEHDSDGGNVHNISTANPNEEPAVDLSEDGVALMLADKHKENMRYVAKWGKWLMYSGKVWEDDETSAGLRAARDICRDMAFTEAQTPSEKKNLKLGRTVASVMRLCTADLRIAAKSNIWDLDPMLLNTQDTVVRLDSGEHQSHCYADYMRKITSVAPIEMPIPEWDAFLFRIMNGDQELIDYIQVMCGYFLTGQISEHAVFFGYGLGANGKGTFVKVVTDILGEYHKAAAMEVFLRSDKDRHKTELARLEGARLVTSSETHQGRAWDEAKLKMLTGGDKITANFMQKDQFEFFPQFKLFISGNHKPGLRSVDEAIKRRFHLIPFAVTIPEAERDPYLGHRLEEEYPGILAWMVQGCLKWQAQGIIKKPRAVVEATAEYMQSEDVLSSWLRERTVKTGSKNDFITTRLLYTSWSEWAKNGGEFVGSEKKFSNDLLDRGYEKAPKRNIGGGFYGIRLKTSEGSESYVDQEEIPF